MSSAIDQVEFTSVAGERTDRTLRLYALSTCAFCKRAMDYLERHGFAYEFIHLDKIDFDLKKNVKKELKKKYDNVPVFPILTIDDASAISGFVEDKWASSLGIE